VEECSAERPCPKCGCPIHGKTRVGGFIWVFCVQCKTIS